MSALEGAPGCVGAVRGGCAWFSYFYWVLDVTSKTESSTAGLVVSCLVLSTIYYLLLTLY